MDIVFSDNPYEITINKEIANNLLLSNGEPVSVRIPSPDCILADKLTAFAPHTTGIELGRDKDLEVMKQLFDVANLIELISNQEALKTTFDKTVRQELDYRNIDLTPEDVLRDTIDACLCIISRGLINPKEYPLFLKGIRALDSHVMNQRYTGEIAANQASKVMYLASTLITKTSFKKIVSPEKYISSDIENNNYKKLKYMKKQNIESFGYIVETMHLLKI